MRLEYRFEFETISKFRTELMGLAIMGVMLGHLMNHTWQPHILAGLARSIHTPGFLFLSGFGLYYSFSKNSDLKSFFNKRITRLFIPFLLIALPFFTVLLLLGRCSLLQFIGYVTTAAFWYEGNYYAMWYVAVSLVLYALFPLLYYSIFNKYNRPILFFSAVMIIMIVLFAGIQYLFPAYWNTVEFGLSKTYMFPIGCVCGYFAKQKKSVSWYYLLLYLLFCGVLYLYHVNRSVTLVMMCIPIASIILDLLMHENQNKGVKLFLFWFGKHSLELYLLHIFIYFSLMDFCGINDSISMSTGIILALILCHPFSLFINKITSLISRPPIKDVY